MNTAPLTLPIRRTGTDPDAAPASAGGLSPDVAGALGGPDGPALMLEMVHDLRSPLTAILVLTDALRNGRHGDVTDAQRRQLDLVYSAALGICATSSDLLELAKHGGRLTDPQPAQFSLAELLESVRSMILPLAEGRGTEVRIVSADPDLRFGYARPLSRVLLNLATNAAKVTDGGVVELRVTSRGGSALEFAVEDTGPGLDAEALRSVFQPFRPRPGEIRKHFSSAGLGLAICRKLVRAMGAQLEVESRRGEGTRFHFTLDLPAARAA